MRLIIRNVVFLFGFFIHFQLLSSDFKLELPIDSDSELSEPHDSLVDQPECELYYEIEKVEQAAEFLKHPINVTRINFRTICLPLATYNEDLLSYMDRVYEILCMGDNLEIFIDKKQFTHENWQRWKEKLTVKKKFPIYKKIARKRAQKKLEQPK